MAGRIAYLGNIATQGLVLDLDAAIQGSYPKTGTLWTDISGNNNNGTLTNGPAYTGSDFGAIVFDGTDDYVEVGDVASLDQTFNNITINTWLKPALVSTEKAIMGKMGGSGNRGFQFTLFSGSTVTMDYFSGPSGTEAVLYTPSPLLSSSFSNVCFVFNGGISHTFYQNGAPITSSTISIPATFNGSNNVPFRLGDRGDNVISKYTGSIANTQIYNQALSQFQVWQNFNAYKSRYGIPDIVTNGLVLNLDAGNPYSYLSGSSGTAWSNTVAVSSSISGTLVNGTTYSNGAMVFDGTNDYVSIPAHPTSSGLTLSFWAYIPSTLGTLPTLIGDGSQSNTVGYIWIYRSNINQVTWQFATDTVRNLINVPTIFSGSLNSWANYVFVADYTNYPTGSLTVYKNGVLSTTTTFPNIQIPLSRTRFIGSYDGGLYQLSGSISSYLEYDKALTQAEITQNFNALRGRYGI